jgi:hypothetical protein
VNFKLKKSTFLVLLLFIACQKNVTNIKDRIPKYEITSTCYDSSAQLYNVDVLFSNCKNSDTQICVYTVRGIGVDSVIALGINGIHHVQLSANSLDTGGISVYVKNADTLYPSKTKIPDREACD